MVNKENLQKLSKQTLVKTFLINEAMRKINFLEDKVLGKTHKDFKQFDKIISNNNIFVGSDNELYNLKELTTLLEAI